MWLRYINKCQIMHIFFCSGLSFWNFWIKAPISEVTYWFLKCFRMTSVELYMECDLQRTNKALKRMLHFSVIPSPTSWHLSEVTEGTWEGSRDAWQVHWVRRQKESIAMHNHLKWLDWSKPHRSVTDRRLSITNRNVECIIHSRSEDPL